MMLKYGSPSVGLWDGDEEQKLEYRDAAYGMAVFERRND
jgi:hypothetical protein